MEISTATPRSTCADINISLQILEYQPGKRTTFISNFWKSKCQWRTFLLDTVVAIFKYIYNSITCFLYIYSNNCWETVYQSFDRPIRHVNGRQPLNNNHNLFVLQIWGSFQIREWFKDVNPKLTENLFFAEWFPLYICYWCLHMACTAFCNGNFIKILGKTTF